MKTCIIFLLLAGVFTACEPQAKDSVKEAHNENLNSAIDEETSEFMTEAADASMMAIDQGNLAKVRGTSPAIREYGELMIRDHERMLKDLRDLATRKNIALPSELSNKKADGLEELKQQQGEEFDRKFVEMTVIDHKRDVDDFEDARNVNDEDVKLYAETYLPVVRSHLEKIREIEENSSVAKGD